MNHNIHVCTCIGTCKCIGKGVGESIKHYLSASRKMDSKDNSIFMGKSMYTVILWVIRLCHVYIAEITQQTVT